MAFALSQELDGRGVTAVAVTPGFLRSEWMLDHFGVSEANWRDAAVKVKEFIASEAPLFVGAAWPRSPPTRRWRRRTGGSSPRGTSPRSTA
jgi:NAD(P)-dependent dehydrogenase (short-subunit alcohol dehydrogenase family)